MTKQPHELTLREVAEVARMAPDTVRGWIKTGQLPARRVGPQGQYRVDPEALSRFLDHR